MHSSYFVNLWVTYRCNFRCRYCYVKPLYNDLDLNIENVDNIINYIKRQKKKEQRLIINFHGGEPLLNFETIIYFIKKCDEIFGKVSYGMTTNGYLLDDDLIEFIAKKFDFNLSISIDGMENTHEYNRISLDGKNTHQVIMKNAIKLLELNPKVRIRMTYDRHNIKSIFQNFKYFLDHGFTIIVPTPDSYSKEWVEEDFLTIKDEFLKIRSYILKNNYKNVKVRMLEQFQPLNHCTAGSYYYSIDVKGNIYPCTAIVGKTEYIIGNVVDGVDDEKFNQVKRMICKKIKSCENCAIYDCCEATRCLLVNYSINGDCFKPNLVECNMMNVKLQLIEEYGSNL